MISSYDLLRIDPHGLTVTATWPMPSRPAAVVVTDHYVWVAVSSGRPNVAGPDASDEVQQLDLTGRLRHTYTNLSTIDTMAAGTGDSVWVDYGQNGLNGNGKTVTNGRIVHLHDGTTDAPIELSGVLYYHDALTVCPDGIYVSDELVFHTSTYDAGGPAQLTRIVPGRAPVVDQGAATDGPMWCAAGGGIVTVGSFPTGNLGIIVRKDLTDGKDGTTTLAVPGWWIALGSCQKGIWIADGSAVRLMDFSTRLGGQLKLQSVYIGTADGCTLWTLSPDAYTGSLIITEIDPP
jgi:hypothetical protein